MFNRIRIKAFRSCKDVTLERLGHMTALVGRNGAGKTNLLRAIDWLARTTTARESTPNFPGWRGAEKAMLVESEIALKGHVYRLGIGLNFEQEQGKSFWPMVSLREKLELKTSSSKWQPLVERHGSTVDLNGYERLIEVTPTVPCLPFLETNFTANTVIKEHIQPLLRFLSATRYYPMDESSQPLFEEGFPIILDNQYQQWLTRYRASGNPSGPLPIRILYALLEKPELAAIIRSLMGASGLGLVELLEPVVTPFGGNPVADRSDEGGGKFYQVRFRPGPQLGGGKNLRFFGELSLGTRRVLSIVTSLVLDDSTVLLLEHPEDGIHSGLLKQLINLLKITANPAQIILSSHSENVLSRLDPNDIRLVTIHRGATIARQLTEQEIQRAGKFIAEEGTLGEFVDTIQQEE